MYATYMHINVSETCLFVFSARLMVDVYSKQAHFFSALANEENSNGFYRHRTHTSRAIWNMLERIGAVGCFFRLLLPRTPSQLYIPHNGRWLPCAVGAHEPGKRQSTVIFCSHVISVGFEVLVRPHISCAPSNWLTPISDFAGFCFILFFLAHHQFCVTHALIYAPVANCTNIDYETIPCQFMAELCIQSIHRPIEWIERLVYIFLLLFLF